LKKTATAVMAIFTVLIAVLDSSVDVAQANWLVPVNPSPPPRPEVSILLPEANSTCSSTVGLDFRVIGRTWIWYGGFINVSSVSYSLDDGPAVPVSGEQVFSSDKNSLIVHLLGSLTGLSSGVHSLIVYADCVGKYSAEPYKWTDFAASGKSPKIHFNVDANIADTVLPAISIVSPENESYETADIPLTLNVNEQCSKLMYSLDEQKKTTIDGNISLAGLSDGTHSLSVYAYDLAGNAKSAVTRFKVAVPPTVSIVSPENTIYYARDLDSANLTLSFVVSEFSYAMWYSLDGQGNYSTAGNSTLTRLTYGSHSLVVFASDLEGNIGCSETVNFVLTSGDPLLLPLAASVAVIAVVVAVSAVVYLKKRRGVVKNP
jgi:hypothetical protein